jgi:hypothetical protein
MTYIINRQKYNRPQGMLWSESYVAPATSNDPLAISGFEFGSNAPEANQTFLILSDHNRKTIDISTDRIQNRERMINGRMRSFHIADKIKISTSWEMLPSRRSAEYSNFRTVFSTAITSAVGNGATITYIATGTNIELTVGEYVSITGISIAGYNKTNAEVLSVVESIDGLTTTFTIAGTTTGTPTYTDAKITTTGAKTNYIASEEYTVDGGAGGADILDWYEGHTGPFYVYLSYDKPKNFKAEGNGNNGNYDRLDEYSEVVEMYISDFSYTVARRGGTNYDFWDISVTLEEV